MKRPTKSDIKKRLYKELSKDLEARVAEADPSLFVKEANEDGITLYDCYGNQFDIKIVARHAPDPYKP